MSTVENHQAKNGSTDKGVRRSNLSTGQVSFTSPVLLEFLYFIFS